MRGIGTWAWLSRRPLPVGLHVHQPRVLAVLHVADQNAVLDQRGAVGRRALVVDRERAAAALDGAVVHHGDALGGDLLAHQAGERRGLLAVEVAFEAVADRLVQHDAGPAGAEHDVHLAGRGGNRVEIEQRLAHRLVDGVLPGLAVDEALIAFAAAVAVGAAFLPVAGRRHHRHVDPNQRTDVAIGLAVGPQDLDHLPRRAEARGDLLHALVLGAGIGVDGFQQLHLGVEARRFQRIVVAVELAVGAARRLGVFAGVAALDRAHRVGGARDRALRHVGGVRVADRLVLHGAQAEALVGVVGRLLEPAVVEHQHLGLLVFEEQLAVVGAFEPAVDQLADADFVEAGAVEEGGVRIHLILRIRHHPR